MKIEGLSNSSIQGQHIKKVHLESDQGKDFSNLVKTRDAGTQGINLPKNTSKDMVQDFAEWYFKLGKTYESSKSYKQAISAYEKSNSVKPDINKSELADGARSKALKKDS